MALRVPRADTFQADCHGRQSLVQYARRAALGQGRYPRNDPTGWRLCSRAILSCNADVRSVVISLR